MALRKVLVSVSALGCLVVAFVAGGGSAANATQGQAVLAGLLNSATSATFLCDAPVNTCGGGGSTADGMIVVTAQNGAAGIRGTGPAYGLYGSSTGVGAYGSSTGGGDGVYGQGANGLDGVGTENGVQATGGTFGVFASGTDYGVFGSAPNHGVYGRATDNAGAGLEGEAASASGFGLRVTGKVELSRSGTATIAGTSTTPLSSVVVSGVALSAKSIVFTTVQKNITGTWVRAAVPNVAGSSVTIYLNKAVTKSVPVAWMVIEQP